MIADSSRLIQPREGFGPNELQLEVLSSVGQGIPEVLRHGSTDGQLVDQHVAAVPAEKLERDPANPKHILTVRKTGYRLAR